MRYSPHPPEKYTIVTLDDCEVRIVMREGVAAWNLFWLSYPRVDKLVRAGKEWYMKYKVKPGLLTAVIDDVNDNVSLRKYLIQPPGVFLRWFERQTMRSSPATRSSARFGHIRCLILPKKPCSG